MFGGVAVGRIHVGSRDRMERLLGGSEHKCSLLRKQPVLGQNLEELGEINNTSFQLFAIGASQRRSVHSSMI